MGGRVLLVTIDAAMNLSSEMSKTPHFANIKFGHSRVTAERAWLTARNLPVRRVVSLRMMPTSERVRRAGMEVTSADCSDRDRSKCAGSVKDPRSGPGGGQEECARCKAYAANCSGHSMFIQLPADTEAKMPRMIFSPLALTRLEAVPACFQLVHVGGEMHLGPLLDVGWEAVGYDKPFDRIGEVASKRKSSVAVSLVECRGWSAAHGVTHLAAGHCGVAKIRINDKKMGNVSEVWTPARLYQELDMETLPDGSKVPRSDDQFRQIGFSPLPLAPEGAEHKAWLLEALFQSSIYVTPYPERQQLPGAPVMDYGDLTNKLKAIAKVILEDFPAFEAKNRAAAATYPATNDSTKDAEKKLALLEEIEAFYEANVIDYYHTLILRNAREAAGDRSNDRHHVESIIASMCGKNRQLRDAMSKRLDNTGRTVVAASSDCKSGEIAMPLVMMNRNTVTETVRRWNKQPIINKLLAIAERGGSPGPHITINPPSATGMQRTNVFQLMGLSDIKARITSLAEGDVVTRSLVNGDTVWLNRQPTLWDNGYLGFRIKMGTEEHVIGMNPMDCPSFNADFDGDEMNTIAVRFPSGAFEVAALGSRERRMISRQAGNPVLSLALDSMVGFHLASKPDTVIRAEHLQGVLRDASDKVVALASTFLTAGDDVIHTRDLLSMCITAHLGDTYCYRTGGKTYILNGRVVTEMETKQLARRHDGLLSHAIRSRGTTRAKEMLDDTYVVCVALARVMGVTLRMTDYQVYLSSAMAEKELQAALTEVKSSRVWVDADEADRIQMLTAALEQLMFEPWRLPEAARDRVLGEVSAWLQADDSPNATEVAALLLATAPDLHGTPEEVAAVLARARDTEEWLHLSHQQKLDVLAGAAAGALSPARAAAMNEVTVRLVEALKLGGLAAVDTSALRLASQPAMAVLAAWLQAPAPTGEVVRLMFRQAGIQAGARSLKAVNVDEMMSYALPFMRVILRHHHSGRCTNEDFFSAAANIKSAANDIIEGSLPDNHPLIVFLKKAVTKNKGNISTVSAPMGDKTDRSALLNKKDLSAINDVFKDRASISFPANWLSDPEAQRYIATSLQRGVTHEALAYLAAHARIAMWKSSMGTADPGHLNKIFNFSSCGLHVNEDGGLSDGAGCVVQIVHADTSARDRMVEVLLTPVAPGSEPSLDEVTLGTPMTAGSAEAAFLLRAGRRTAAGVKLRLPVPVADIHETLVRCSAAGERVTAEEAAALVEDCADSIEETCWIAGADRLYGRYDPDDKSPRAVLNPILAALWAVFDPARLAGCVSKAALQGAMARFAAEYRMSRIEPGENAGSVAVTAIFQGFTQKSLDSVHANSDSADYLTRMRNVANCKNSRPEVSARLRAGSPQELEYMVERARAWLTKRKLSDVASIRVVSESFGDAFTSALFFRFPEARMVLLTLDKARGWTAKLLQSAVLKELRDMSLDKHLANADAPAFALEIPMAVAGSRQAAQVAIMVKATETNRLAAALAGASVGLLRKVSVTITGNQAQLSGAVALPLPKASPLRTLIEAPPELGILPTSVSTNDPQDALLVKGAAAFRATIVGNLRSIFGDSVDSVHFRVIADFMACNACHSDDKLNRPPNQINPRGILTNSAGDFTPLFYMNSRKVMYRMVFNGGSENATFSPVVNKVVNSAPLRRGSQFTDFKAVKVR
jgi:hypothetical protein